MRRLAIHPSVYLLISLCACSSTEKADDAPRGAPGPDSARATPAAKALTGLFVPGAPAEIPLWPEAYRGELMVLTVVPHGAPVEAGQELVALDARAFERELASAEFELRAAELAHETLAAKQALAEEDERARLERARAALERARRSLEGYKQHELVFAQRGDELARSREANQIEDQEDELEQLQMMYTADELTDATEDLVLKRSRRDLELTRQRNQLSEDQRGYQAEFQRAQATAEREEAYAKEVLELAHLERSTALEGQTRAVALQRSARELEHKREDLALLQRDRELFALRAPASGVFLHGDPDDYRPGAVPAPLEPGAKLQARSVVGHVADPRPTAVALDLDGAAAATALASANGERVDVRPAGRPGAKAIEGRLVIDEYPTPGKAGAVYRSRVELGAPVEGLRTGMPAEVDLSGAE
jgi:hypothetical protein